MWRTLLSSTASASYTSPCASPVRGDRGIEDARLGCGLPTMANIL